MVPAWHPGFCLGLAWSDSSAVSTALQPFSFSLCPALLSPSKLAPSLPRCRALSLWPPVPRMCGPEPAPRGLWWDVRRCPSQSETDAIQIETDAILDMADLLVTSGLATAGYTLLAVGSCATIQSPTIRAAIQAYIAQRGLSIVFASHGAERQALSALPLRLHLCRTHQPPSTDQPPPTTDRPPPHHLLHRRRGRWLSHCTRPTWTRRRRSTHAAQVRTSRRPDRATALRTPALPSRCRLTRGQAGGTTPLRCCPLPRRCARPRLHGRRWVVCSPGSAPPSRDAASWVRH